MAFLPLVAPIARRIRSHLPPDYELADLTQAGMLGLLDAAARYDATLAVPFPAWARLRIRQAILDAVRDSYSTRSDSYAIRADSYSFRYDPATEIPEIPYEVLTQGERKLIALIYQEGETCEQIGRRRAFGVGATQTRICHLQALAKLREALQKPPRGALFQKNRGFEVGKNDIEGDMKPAQAEQAEPLTLAEKIDRVAMLESMLAPMKPAIKELAALKTDIGAAFVGLPEIGGRIEGNSYFAMVTPRKLQRKITSMRKVFKALGQRLFMDNCGFTLEKFEALVPAAEQAGMISETRTGNRDVETFAKLPIAA